MARRQHAVAAGGTVGVPGAGVALRLGKAAILAAFACLLPFLLGDYQSFQLTLVLVYAIAILGLNLLTGYTGQISLGHGAFYALGAYVSAILMSRFGLPYWSTLPAAGLICFAFGFLFAFPALRLEGLYLALATFALALAVPQLLKYKLLEPWTGGVQGVVLEKPDPPFGLPLSQDQWLYFFTLAVAALLFWLAWNLLRGRIGRAMLAIRDHPIAAATMGVHTSFYKTMTFGISATYTGIAGALGAIALQYVAPDSFSFLLSITLLVGVVVGGIGSLSGAVYGGLFIQFMPNLADQISKAAPWAIYGLALILCMYVAPNGIAGVVRAALNWMIQAGARSRTP
jgi:branched-chain amino acid transport system permease protein